MTVRQIEPLTKAVPYDSPLRWLVPSESDPHEAYLVDLGSFKGNGECQCVNFEVARRPFLVRGKSPEWAVENDLPGTKVKRIKLKAGERVSDALRCKHIRDAHYEYSETNIRAEAAAEAVHGSD